MSVTKKKKKQTGRRGPPPAELADGEFGAIVRKLRESKGLTQTGLAVAAGITLNAVHNYEQGRRQPNFVAASKLAAALGVKMEDLLG